ncbi:MAG: PepSY-like domain-containing protein [Bacteroidales bacterium]|nr:PepSY-like domain-containing protein [Bacteroidales bacterium]
MKRTIIPLAAIILAATSCLADGRKTPITVQGLPDAGQQLLNTHFAGMTASYIVKETDFADVDYDIRLENGTEIDLDDDGNWTKIDCRRNAVPEGLVPAEILSKVKETFPGAFIVEIERERRGFDVELNNGLEVKFDRKFNLSL